MQENLVKLKSDLVSIKKTIILIFLGYIILVLLVYINIRNLFILINNTFCDLLHKPCNKNEMLVLLICLLISNNIYSVQKIFCKNTIM